MRSESHTQRKRNVIRIAVAAICAVSILALGIFVRLGLRQLSDTKGHAEIELQDNSDSTIETPSSTPVFYLNE